MPAEQTTRRTVMFSDTPDGRRAMAAYLLAHYGPEIEYRPALNGVEIRPKQEEGTDAG